MQNIITRMTGATLKLTSAGSNVLVDIEGTPSAIKHAVTLLYNFNGCDWPSWYDDEAQQTFTFMHLRACKRGFIRGMLALVKTHDVVQWSKRDARKSCVRAILYCARQLRETMETHLPIESNDDLISA